VKRLLPSAALAAVFLLSGVSVDALLAPAVAQADDGIDFDTFHDQLAQYGDWVYSDRWGEVWIPGDVPEDFTPYGTNGYWADTDEYGWTWVSNYAWGDIPFHFGRWVNDPDAGWLWIPGYVWSPAWVIWRSNGQYIGWMPTPPDPEFLGIGGASVGISSGGFGISVDYADTGGYYGYSQWYGSDYNEDRFASNWVFVDTAHIADRDFGRYRAPRAQYATIIHNTTNITNYTVVNNYIVNRSVDPRIVQRASGHAVVSVHIDQVIKRPQFIAPADRGRQVQARMRTQMPRGTGSAGSAPKPSTQVVQSLSTKVTLHAAHANAHLYTRDTVTNAPLPAKPGGTPPPAAPAGAADHAPTKIGGTPGATHRHETPGTTQGAGGVSPPAETDHRRTVPAPTPAAPPTQTERRHELPAQTTPVTPTETEHRQALPVQTPPVETRQRHEVPTQTVPPITPTPAYQRPHTEAPQRVAPPVTASPRRVGPKAEKPAAPPPPSKPEDKHDDKPH
jgi:hypothetical protein